ncbi:MAG TPA: SAM-dependent methyltransferase [Trebonia sp.]|nr:SAM-dependent methyltransferase [Trebonia sp.]
MTNGPDRDDLPGVDFSRPHSARMYDYYLGGKDNISQEVSGLPYSGLSGAIQRGSACFSNMSALTVQ